MNASIEWDRDGRIGDRNDCGVVSRRILLAGYRLPVRIGVYENERQGPQDILIDVDLELADLSPDFPDDLGAVIDYDFLRDGIVTLTADRHFNLLETLCHAILDLLRTRTGIARARIHIRKPNLYAGCKAVGYEITYRF